MKLSQVTALNVTSFFNLGGKGILLAHIGILYHFYFIERGVIYKLNLIKFHFDLFFKKNWDHFTLRVQTRM